MLSEKLRRRVDLENYFSTASRIENAVPMRAGGLKLRPGMSIYAPEQALPAGSRIFAYTVSADESYTIVVAPGRLYIYGPDGNGGIKNVAGNGFPVPYAEEDIPEIVTTQNYECMVMCQRNHPPYVISKNKGEDGFLCNKISLVVTTDRTNDDGSAFLWSYDGLFTERDYPASCAFMSERLWLMGSNDHPCRMWASRAFDIFNFQTKDWYSYLDETLTAEQYMKALSQYGSKSEDIASDDTISFKDTKTVSSEGYVSIVKGIVEKKTGEFIAVNDARLTEAIVASYDLKDDDGNVVNPKSEAFYYTKAVTKWEEVVREDCALELDPSSDRDERISWIGYAGSAIYVGTTSSEWAIPSDISATNSKKDKMGSYGSASYRQCAYGANSLFYIQSGMRRLRAITVTEDGVVFSEPTYQADDIFEGDGCRIKEIAWQRVPEPRLYATMENGDIAVYSYDPYYGMNAWCIWHSDYKVLSSSIRDTEDGQELLCLIEDTDGNVSFGIFEDGRLYDGEKPVKAVVITNNIDSSSTMSYRKVPYNIFLDTMQTEFKVSQSGLPIQASRNYGRDLVKLALNGSPTSEGLRIRVESIEGKPFTLLAIIAEVEVS